MCGLPQVGATLVILSGRECSFACEGGGLGASLAPLPGLLLRIASKRSSRLQSRRHSPAETPACTARFTQLRLGPFQLAFCRDIGQIPQRGFSFFKN
jgi:hypothetical protein